MNLTNHRTASLEMDEADETSPAVEFSKWTRLIAAGDEAAFNEFFARYSNRVFRLLLIITQGNEDLSLELHQITMIKAAKKFKPFQREPELWAWLSQVARNAFVDHVRKENLLARFFRRKTAAAIEPDHAEESELLDRLEAALAKISPEELALIDSIYFQQKTQKEVADETGITPKAVESRLARIRQRLKKIFLAEIQNEKR